MKRNLLVFSLFSWLAIFSAAALAAIPTGFEVYFNDAQHSDPAGIDVALTELIDSADSSLACAFYSIERTIIVDAMIAASIRLGVQNVRVITDAHYRNNPACQRLESAGIYVIDETSDGWEDDSVQSHNKFCVVDAEKVWTGSYNITNSGSVYNNNNAVLVDCPDLAAAYLAEFNEMWGATSGPPGDTKFSTNKQSVYDHEITCSGVPLELFFSATQEDSPNRALDRIVEIFDNAAESLYFCIYTFTSYPIAGAVIHRHQAGITVQGVMDNVQAGYSSSKYTMLINAGVDVLLDDEVQPHGNLLHHKMAVVDYDTENATVITGSYNWTTAAQFDNDENTLIIHNRDIAKLFYNEFYRCYHGQNPPEGDPVITIQTNQPTYQGGNYMRVFTDISNPGDQLMVNECVILDLGEPFGADRFYFWPSFSKSFDYQTMMLNSGQSLEQEILGFVLPYPLPPSGPFAFWAAFLDTSNTALVGDYSYTEFSFE